MACAVIPVPDNIIYPCAVVQKIMKPGTGITAQYRKGGYNSAIQEDLYF